MQTTTKTTARSAFALAGVLTLALTGCAAEESDVSGDGGDGSETAAEAAAIESVDELVIGLVPSQENATVVENQEAIADQVSEELDGFDVTVEVFDDYLGVIQGMQTGDVHLVMSGPVGMIQAEQEADGTSILQSVRYGSESYVTQWFTDDPDTYCQDEPVEVEQEEDGVEPFLFCNGIVEDGEKVDYQPMGEEALEQIEDGTTVSFVDEGSASGYYYPQTQLNELGIEVDGQFAGGHDQSVQNVYSGDIAIGTSFDDARENLAEENPDVGQEVVTFAWAGPIPNDGIVASAELTEEEQQTITDAFLSIAGDGGLEEGDPLYDVYEIEGLVEADQEALDGARTVYEEFGDQAE